jgi:hypothetical protein
MSAVPLTFWQNLWCREREECEDTDGCFLTGGGHLTFRGAIVVGIITLTDHMAEIAPWCCKNSLSVVYTAHPKERYCAWHNTKWRKPPVIIGQRLPGVHSFRSRFCIQANGSRGRWIAQPMGIGGAVRCEPTVPS